MRRLYNAICSWLEADAQAKCGGIEPQPEGNNFAQADHAHAYTTQPEMHAGHRGTSIDDDDGGAYRIGFQRNTATRPPVAAETITQPSAHGTAARPGEAPKNDELGEA